MNVLILHDSNFTADPYCIDKLKEIKERKLIVDINQGCDVRLKHFARWVNSRIYKKCTNFEEYGPWVKAQVKYNQLSFI